MHTHLFEAHLYKLDFLFFLLEMGVGSRKQWKLTHRPPQTPNLLLSAHTGNAALQSSEHFWSVWRSLTERVEQILLFAQFRSGGGEVCSYIKAPQWSECLLAFPLPRKMQWEKDVVECAPLFPGVKTELKNTGKWSCFADQQLHTSGLHCPIHLPWHDFSLSQA